MVIFVVYMFKTVLVSDMFPLAFANVIICNI